MQTSHNINYYGLQLEVFGEYEQPEPYSGYNGGWATERILLNEIEVSWMFTPFVIEQINICVIEENY